MRIFWRSLVADNCSWSFSRVCVYSRNFGENKLPGVDKPAFVLTLEASPAFHHNPSDTARAYLERNNIYTVEPQTEAINHTRYNTNNMKSIYVVILHLKTMLGESREWWCFASLSYL